MLNTVCWRLLGVAVLSLCFSAQSSAQLTELAFYHLGEEDAGVSAGEVVVTTVESLGITLGIDMEAAIGGGVNYSADTPDGIDSSLSVEFDSSSDYLFAPSTPWHDQYAGFRVGMEAFLKVDPNLDGTESVPFGNGSAYHLGITSDGFYSANTTGPGITPVKFGEWQHVAFISTGSSWQVYVDGVPQFETLPNFFYNSPSGDATLGEDAVVPFQGLIDEHRVFTWTGAFNPAELLWFAGRDDAGDVNEDGAVNQLDYDIWRMNVGADLSEIDTLAGRALGDLDGNGQINLVDFGLIKDNKSPGVIFNLSVPEPSACLLLMIGCATFAARRQRKAQHALKSVLLMAALVLVAQPSDLFAQATWGGGDGNWNDANWSGGSGLGGSPDSGDTIILPSGTGTITVSNDIGLSFDNMEQRGGILKIESGGVLDFLGNIQTGVGTDTTGEIDLAGSLLIGGGFDIGFEVAAKVTLRDSASLSVIGNMDTWWGGVAQLDIFGPNVEVEVEGTFFLGPGANMAANIDGSTYSTINVPGNVGLQGGSLEVNFSGGVSPAVGDSWTIFDSTERSGQITNVSASNLGPGLVLAAEYPTGGDWGELVTVNIGSTLNLVVDTANGNTLINNPATGTGDFEIDGYIIKSASDSLSDAGFTGMSESGWMGGLDPSQSSSLLSDTNLNDATTVGSASSFAIGNAFSLGGTEDLTFEYRLASGEVLQGTVEYIQSAVSDADFDGDNDVDGADFLSWQRGLGISTGAESTDGDANGDGAVNAADVAIWKQQYGSVAAVVGSSSVPEPTALALCLTAMLTLVSRRRA